MSFPARLALVAAAFAVVIPLTLSTLAAAQNSAPPSAVAPPEPLPAPASPAPQMQIPTGIAPPPPMGDAASAPGERPAVQNILPDAEAQALPRNLSPWGMFVAADWVVKAVMIGLAFASVVTWTVWLVKSLQIASARLSAYRGMRRLQQIADLRHAAEQGSGKGDVVSALAAAAIDEVTRSADLVGEGLAGGIRERIADQLASVESSAARRMTRGAILVATIGATAPFVGLFGTVWGIMNAFIGISEAQTTNLAIVAPGIAEALLATAIGLAAAIPAVVLYNMLSRAIGGYRKTLADASREVMRLASRDLDRAIAFRPAQAAE